MSGVRWGGGVSLLRREIYDLLPGSSVRGLRARGLFCDGSGEFSKLDFHWRNGDCKSKAATEAGPGMVMLVMLYWKINSTFLDRPKTDDTS